MFFCRGHQNRRYSVTACFDGNKRVVSGSEDGNIYVWDINSSKSVVQKLPGHNGERGVVILFGSEEPNQLE